MMRFFVGWDNRDLVLEFGFSLSVCLTGIDGLRSQIIGKIHSIQKKKIGKIQSNHIYNCIAYLAI